ncbi:APC family permease [Amycolatopsis mediterranei]|uniref:APC family permease n=1 Tax=Amycolatopsis mediterranei TaxID=33910 RepID=UPI003424110B
MLGLRRRSPASAGLDAELGGLSAPSITARVVSAATPMTVVAGVVPVGIAATGANFPLVFLMVAGVYALFCGPYLAASRCYPTNDASSAFYSLIRHGMGKVIGVGAGWVAVAAYTALTLGLYGLIGSVLSPLLSALFAVAIPWQVVACGAALLVGGLGLLPITAPTRLLSVLVVCEAAMILVVTVANLAHPAPGAGIGAALNPHQLGAGTSRLSAQLALAVLGYIGTELTVVHTEKARSGHRGVAWATYAAIAVLTVLYFLAPVGLSVTLGVEGVVTAAQADPAGLFGSTAHSNLGAAAATLMQALLGTSLLAGAVSFHGTTSLYALYLGRSHGAPAIIQKASRRHGTPYVASVAQTVLALLAILIVSISGADPVTVLFYLGDTAGAVGILALLLLTALAAAIILMRRTPVAAHDPAAAGSDQVTHRGWAAAAAVAATAVLGVLIATVMVKLDTLLNVPTDSPLPAIVQMSYLLVLLAGAAWAGWHWLFRPEIFAKIGTPPTTITAPVRVGGL